MHRSSICIQFFITLMAIRTSSASTMTSNTTVVGGGTKATVLLSSSVDEFSKKQTLIQPDNNNNNDNATIVVVSNHYFADPFEHPLVPPTLPIREWPHQSILLHVGANTRVFQNPTATATTTTTTTESSSSSSLPLGIPIDFETSLFRGQFLVRLWNNTSDDPKSHHAYFHPDRKRLFQTVVQGQFKKEIVMSDLYVGTIFRQPIKYVPPPFVMRLLRGLFARIAPGAILDFTSNTPKIISLYSASAKTMSIDIPGQEPDIRSIDLFESIGNINNHAPGTTTAVSESGSTNHSRRKSRKNHRKQHHTILNTNPNDWSCTDRQRILSHPDTAAQYVFDTQHVYTMEMYDESMDYGNYEIHLPIYGNFNFSEAIGIQPMTFTAVTTQNEIMYDFALWHESSILQRQMTTITTATA